MEAHEVSGNRASLAAGTRGVCFQPPGEPWRLSSPNCERGLLPAGFLGSLLIQGWTIHVHRCHFECTALLCLMPRAFPGAAGRGRGTPPLTLSSACSHSTLGGHHGLPRADALSSLRAVVKSGCAGALRHMLLGGWKGSLLLT